MYSEIFNFQRKKSRSRSRATGSLGKRDEVPDIFLLALRHAGNYRRGWGPGLHPLCVFLHSSHSALNSSTFESEKGNGGILQRRAK